MKKIIKLIVIAILVLVVLAVLAVHFFLDAGLKRGVETVGPMMTKVPVKVDSVSLSIMSGSGNIKGLVVGNPEGYKTPSAISVGKSTLSMYLVRYYRKRRLSIRSMFKARRLRTRPI